VENQAPKPVRIELTDEQKARLRDMTGKEVEALEFTAEELEARITPRQPLN
jgi:hypothetical protein